MKFTTATALFAISASVASAAPAFNPQVSVSKAATTTTPSVEQPSIILDFFTVSSVSDKSSKIHTHTRDHDRDHHSHAKTSSAAPAAVSILPVGQESIFIPSGISIHRSVPTTIVSNGQTTVSNVETVSFLHFGPGPARFSPRISTTPSSTVAAHTSTPVVEQLAAESASSGLPFTIHFGFPAQATKKSSSSVAYPSATSIVSRSVPSFVIPSYKTTIYSTIYAKPSTISVVVPKSTITSVVSIPGKMYTVTETVHHQPSVAPSSSAKSHATSSSAKESVTYNQKAATSSSASSSSSIVSLPFTFHNGVAMQRSTLVTSVRSSTTAAPYVASSATPSSSTTSKAAGLPFTLHFGFPMQLTKSSSTTTATESKPTVHYTVTSQSAKSTPVAASYTTTSFIKTTPVAAYTSTSSATPTTTAKKYFFGIF